MVESEGGTIVKGIVFAPAKRAYGVRRGVTMVELLVVIGIIGVLMAITLPAIQSVRETARSTDCRNRLRQLGLAIQHVASDGERGLSSPNRFEHMGHVTEADRKFTGQSTNYLWQCPSNFAGEQSLDWALSYLKVLSGTARNETELASRRDGFYGSQDLRKVYDGTSHTVAIGDGWTDLTIASSDESDRVDRMFNGAELSNEYGSTGVPINSTRRDDIDFGGKEVCFNSRHRGGVNVVYLDGHTRFINQTISPEAWEALGTIAGGDYTSEY